jgi:hypothetical protein
MLKRIATLALLLAVAVAARQACCAEASEARTIEAAPKAASRAPAETKRIAAAGGEEWQTRLGKALERKITLEFVDTPFNDCAKFLGEVTDANLVLDPLLRAPGMPISLKVQNMPASDVLSWFCRLAGAEWELRDHAIHIAPSKDGGARTRMAEMAAPEGAATTTASTRDGARLRVRLASGGEIEADGAALAQAPGMAEQMVEEFFDPAKDGLLCYRGIPGGCTLEELRELCAAAAPKAKLQLVHGLLLVSGDDSRELRRVATLMRQLLLSQHKETPAVEKNARP